MEIKEKITKTGAKYRFVNEYWETSRAWGHKTTIIRNGYDYDPHKVRYYNRTWESYAYQTCMSGALSEIYDDELNRYIENYKNNTGIARFKKGEKEKVIDDFNQTDLGQELLELKEVVRDRNFD